MKRSVVLCGMGSYLPKKILSNADLSMIVETTDEWVFRRTGIRSRHLVGDEESVSDMALEAAKMALDDSGIAARDVDLVIVATATPDRTLPSCAAMLQKHLGCGGFVFDLNAACSGFVYAIAVAYGLIKSDQASVALVVGAEAMSKIVNWEDRTTCVLFGDGAGVVVLKGESSAVRKGIISTVLHSDGTLCDVLYTDGGVSSTGTAGHLCMKGPVLFEYAVEKLVSVIREVLCKSEVGVDAVDWFVLHQANVRIIGAVGRRLGVSADRIVISIEDHANTSAASIPLAMCDARRAGKLQEGSFVLLAAIGAGLTWGACLIKL